MSHLLQLSSEGFFATGTCTGCPWRESGSGAELRVRWAKDHEGDKIPDMPRRVEIPPMSGDPFLDLVEQQIVYLLAHHVRSKADRTLYVSLGLATARALYIRQAEGWSDVEKAELGIKPYDYVSDLTARIANLHKRQQGKLCQAERHRKSQQDILDGGNG